MIDPLLICDLHIFHFRNFSIAQTKDDEGVLHKWGHFLHKLSKMPPKSFRSQSCSIIVIIIVIIVVIILVVIIIVVIIIIRNNIHGIYYFFTLCLTTCTCTGYPYCSCLFRIKLNVRSGCFSFCKRDNTCITDLPF